MEASEGRVSLTREEYALAVRARSDDEAFSILFDRYFPKIYAYVFRRLGDRDTTEDIVAQTFEKVFLHLEKFQPQSGGTFQAWVYRIATNTLIDHVRKEKRVRVTDPNELPEEIHPAHDQLHEVIRSQGREAVHCAIKKLSKRYQEVLFLKYFSDLSNIEVAEVMNISPNNAGVLLSRALKKFHRFYQESESS